MGNDRKDTRKESSPPESPASRPSWMRWILPAVGLIAVVILGLVLRDKLRTDVWAFFTDE